LLTIICIELASSWTCVFWPSVCLF